MFSALVDDHDDDDDMVAGAISFLVRLTEEPFHMF